MTADLKDPKNDISFEDVNDLKTSEEEVSIDLDGIQKAHLAGQRAIVMGIKELELQIRMLEREEERDVEAEGSKKTVEWSLNIIPDGYWKSMVAVVGCVLVLYLIEYVVNLVGVLLRGSAE